MYSQEAIDSIVGLIGFGDLSNPTVDIDTAHKSGTSQRLFSFFHRLVTTDNIYATVEENHLGKTDFNAYLAQMKVDSAKDVLVRIFNQHKDYLDDTDYSDVIDDKKDLIGEVMGYSVAISVLQMMLSSNRSNIKERNARISYSSLMVELEGAKNEYGKKISKGLNSRLAIAIRRAQDIIFPIRPIVQGQTSW